MKKLSDIRYTLVRLNKIIKGKQKDDPHYYVLRGKIKALKWIIKDEKEEKQ